MKMKEANKRVEGGHLRQPGMMRCIDGTLYDLTRMTAGDFSLDNIAWGLGRTLRYGGHIKQDYTVAHHSIVMSYVVPEEYALEALLHDAAESMIGDIIYPVKALFPEIEEFENILTFQIMRQFDVKTARSAQLDNGEFIYLKSEPVADADIRLMEHECFDMGRPGIFHPDIEKAWLAAVDAHQEYWWASQYAFLQRYDQLCGTEHCDLERLTNLWFPEDKKLEKDQLSHMIDEMMELFAAKEGGNA